MSNLLLQRQQMYSQLATRIAGRKKSLQQFVDSYLAHYITCAPSKFHKEEIAFVEEATLHHRGTRDTAAGPRGSAKSTIISLAFPLWAVCEQLERYIILTGDTHTQAVQQLGHVREELESNDALARDYPSACGKGTVLWSRDAIVTRNGIRLDALGAGKKIRGRRHGEHRPTVIVVDDPENDDGVRSPLARERVTTWLEKAVLKAGEPRTNIFVRGTVLTMACLVNQLLTRPGWTSRKYRSICSWPTHMQLWDEWELLYFKDPVLAREFYELNKALMHEGAVVLWEAREPLYELMVMRAEGGHTSFEAEKQNEPLNPANCRFDPKWWGEEYNIWREGPEPGAYWFAAIDPSKGKDAKRGDYIAIMMVAWVPGSKVLFLDPIIDRFPVAQLNTRILALHKERKFLFVVYEINGYQELMAEDLADKSFLSGAQLPIMTIHHQGDKTARIERIGPYHEKGYIKYNSKSRYSKLLIEQEQQFPIGDHDDGPDAEEMVLTALAKWTALHYPDGNFATVINV